jgi:hypothetical protein
MRRSRPLLLSGLLLASGCGWFSPPPAGPAVGDLPPAESRATATDPRLEEAAGDWRRWVLDQKADGMALFSRVEVLPVTMTTLPYGVGSYEQQPRLPVILTTGPGWASLKPQEKEQEAARAYRELNDRVRATGLEQEARPSLTLQTPQGLLLAWINEASSTGKLIHGDGD